MENKGTMSAQDKQKTNKRKRALILGVALLVLVTGFIAGWLGAYFSVDPRLRSLGWMVDKVAGNYYQDVDKDDLYDRMFDALELDKFCTHYTEREYQAVVGESAGNNSGYGMSFSALESDARIYRVVGNSPSERAGLKSGMYVHAFGPSEEELQEGTRSELLAYLGSHESCTLRVGFAKDGTGDTVISVTRASYLGSYCSYIDSEGTFRFRGEKQLELKKMENEGGMSALGADTAYIRLTEFDGNADREFKVCLDFMKARGRTNLIIDLRSNGGGYISIMNSILSHLMRSATEKKPVSMTAHFRKGNTVTYRATGNDFSQYFSANSRIRVLLDENSASASEALVGAMLDYGTLNEGDVYVRKLDDGTAHSYGKGVMQSTFVAPSGDAMRLTVAEIFWPKGRSIHGTGIGAAHGAISVEAPLLPSATDEYLQQII